MFIIINVSFARVCVEVVLAKSMSLVVFILSH